MSSVNKVILVGRLGVDPELRFTQSGTAVGNLSIATSDNWKDKSGQRQERTEWHRVVVWGKQAETCGEFLSKGSLVYLEGRLQTREWTDKENRRQFTTEVVADRVVFLGGGASGERRSGPRGGDSQGDSYSSNYNDQREGQGYGQRDSGPASGDRDYASRDSGFDSNDAGYSGGRSDDDIPF